MNIKIKLLSDTIFGSGASVPGGEDISVQYDENGFPYLKGSTLRGIFKEEMMNYLSWLSMDGDKIEEIMNRLFGKSGYSDVMEQDASVNDKVVFTDFTISEGIKKVILSTDNISSDEILNSLSYMRTFTSIDDDLISKKGSLRSARCIKKGLIFTGEIYVCEEYSKYTADVLKCIKWIGSMRTRGFGNVKISVDGGNK